VKPNTFHRCYNCSKIWDASLLEPIVGRLDERLDAGGVVPSGECRECGALVYPYDKQTEYVETKGLRCPYCSSRELSAAAGFEEGSIESGFIETRVECLACGKTWFDVYKLSGFREEP
jgi:DNA-directed RNA polymerase subunit RPC12/RpoP